MALRPTSREIELALVAATCGTALVLAFAALSPAFGQTSTSSSGLRNLSAPTPAQAPALARPPDAAPLGAQLRSSAATAPEPVGGLVSPPPPPADYSAGAGAPAPGAAINYGKPRKLAKQPLPNPPLKTPKKPLPALEPYKTSSIAKTQMRLRSKTIDPNARPDQPPTGVAVVPTIAVKARKLEEDKPFEPTGISLGSLRLKPYIEGSGGYDTNPLRIQTPLRGYPMLRGDAGGTVQSEWSQHSLKGEMRVGYSDFPGKSKANRPDGMGKLDGRIDVLRDTKIDFGGNFSISTLRPGSPELTWGSNNSISTNQPITWSAGGYVGLSHTFNRLEASLRGTLERSQTGDATFSDGTTQKLSLNDYTTVGAKPRLTYEVTPGLKPFVEATIDRRIYDETYDVNGYMRTSNGVIVRGGASFEVTRQIVGEVSGGYGQRNYEDPRLIPLRGPVVDGALIWTATPLTKVTLRGTTNLNETTIPGASGSISRRISGEIAHALLRNVTITGAAGYQVTNYQGASYQGVGLGGTNVSSINERLLTAGVKVEYNVTRTVVVKASYAFENLKTTVQGSNYTANIFLLGLRLQR